MAEEDKNLLAYTHNNNKCQYGNIAESQIFGVLLKWQLLL